MSKFRISDEIRLNLAASSGRYRQIKAVIVRSGAIILCSLLVMLFIYQISLAEITFNDAFNTQINGVPVDVSWVPCVRLVGGDPNARDGTGVPFGLGPELAAICTTISPPGSSGSISGGGQASNGGGVTTTVPVVERRQRKLREEAKERTGGDDDTEVTLGAGLAAFVSANYEDLDRDRTGFEDGYDSDIWRVTLGADYQVKNSMVVGLALNLARWNGDYDTGGGFDTDSYGATAFASFLPLQYMFLDVSVGYMRNDISEDRRRFYTRDITFTDPGVGTITTTQVFGGRTDADRDDNLWSALLRLGYDFPIRQFNVGPRLALNWLYTDIDGYKERGGSGLELKYQEDSRTLLQSKLGLQASMAISTRIGVFVPQVYGNWVHEFADNQRSISVQFVQDLRPNPTRFSFDTDKPDRNWWELGAGVVLTMPLGFQAFLNVQTIQSNSLINSTSGSGGLRVEF